MAALIGPAQAEPAFFTADAVQMSAGGTQERGRLFVSAQGVRFETGQGALEVVRVVLPAQNVTRILYPADKTYMEFPGAAPLPTDRPDKPCPDGPGVECVKVGSDTVSGLETEKWRLAPAGQPPTLMVWWSPAYKMILRQEFSDGRLVELARRGTEDYEGRTVERWETIYKLPDGRAQRSVKLFDPALGLAVRESWPDGRARWLANIRILQSPDPAWYTVPAGYTRVETPPPPSGAAPALKNGGTP